MLRPSLREGMSAIPRVDGVAFRVIGSFNDWAEDAAPIAREDGGTWYAGSADAKPCQSS
jgi:1,4-alpha-glucan branching enzyme